MTDGVWQTALFPQQCPVEPFETDLPICAGASCPRPCRATLTDGTLTAHAEIHYDANGRWLATLPDLLGDPPLSRREATYENGRLHTVTTTEGAGQYTETVTYANGRVVKTWDGGDGYVDVRYDRDRVVEITHPIGTVTLTYDAAGRLTSTKTEVELRFHYDDAGRVDDIEDPATGEHTRYTFDGERLVRATTTKPDAVPVDVPLSYDASGRITRVGAATYAYCDATP